MTHYFTLRALSTELNAALRGLRITGAFTQQKDELLVTFGTTSTLCISVRPQLNYCFLKDGVTRAKRNTVDLLSGLRDAVIVNVTTLPYERTLVMELEGALRLCARLYGTAASNVLLVDGTTATILDAFKNKEALVGTPSAPGRSFDETVLRDHRRFEDAIRSGPAATLEAALRRAVPFLGKLYAAEILARNSLDASTACDRLDPRLAQKFLETIGDVLQAADNPSPRIYAPDTLAVMPLRHLEAVPCKTLASVNEAIRTAVAVRGRAGGDEAKKRTLAHKLAAELERCRRSLRAVERELQEADRAETYELHGKLIMAQLDLVRKGMKHVDLDNLYGDGEQIRVTLDPAMTPVQNAERMFSKARRSRTSRSEADERKRRLSQNERQLAGLVEECEAAETAGDLEEFQQRHEAELRQWKIGGAARKEEVLPFRVFSVAGGYEVWVGKSSANNDLLTMQYAKPHDIWFHARGASGSHAVLRVRERSAPIPKEAVREAARIAAYYSKMRNAKTVPVAYCERKYVRKPKGAPPGTVTLEREDVMFVDPKLPAQ